MTNPLVELTGLPPFSRIKPEHVEPAVDTLLAECRTGIHRLLEANSVYTWDNLVQPIEDVEDKLDRAWSPVSHMNSVVNSEALRQAYNACLPKLSDYATEMGQNERLFQAFRQIADSDAYRQLDTAQQKVIDNALRDFRLSGVALPPEQRERYRTIMQELSSLTAKFEENLLDATHGWKLNITDETRLAGLPESALDLARQTAEREGQEGWVFNLEFPSYYPVLTYAD
ncbi:MAG TPA: hypothetical protein VK971_08865, partial [Thiohalobacter sp.]|nr:hypothetical protein [Thiohalobacter sp.]